MGSLVAVDNGRKPNFTPMSGGSTGALRPSLARKELLGRFHQIFYTISTCSVLSVSGRHAPSNTSSSRPLRYDPYIFQASCLLASDRLTGRGTIVPFGSFPRHFVRKRIGWPASCRPKAQASRTNEKARIELDEWTLSRSQSEKARRVIFHVAVMSSKVVIRCQD